MTTVYTINLDYRCNERCVFCAADLGGDVPVAVRRPSLTLDQIKAWLAGAPPGPTDRVLLSGGEPTLHRDLLPIIRYLSERCKDVVLFTNGLRLADVEFARATADAGVSRFEISLYGADAAAHDAITRRAGSFDRTLEALRALVVLRPERNIWVSVRLLLSRDTVGENVEIIRRVAADVGAVDSFSLNHLILSKDALDAEAAISWADARSSVNECARLIRGLGYALQADAVPLCVFDADNAAWALEETAARMRRVLDGREPAELVHRYFDPFVPDAPTEPNPRRRSALPDVCLGCGVSRSCTRVDRGYLRLFGEAGLTALSPAILSSR